MSNSRQAVIIDDAQCRGCGLCVLACPAGCLEFSEEINESGYHPIRFAGEGCLADRLCSDTCPVPGAILVVEEAAP